MIHFGIEPFGLNGEQSLQFLIKYNPPDVRSRVRLHGTFLFGSIGGDVENRPPFSKRERLKRKLESYPILVRLREIVTPLGVLIVEGYSLDNDWLPFEQFFPVIDPLTSGQVHFFNVTDDFYRKEDFKQLVEFRKNYCPRRKSCALPCPLHRIREALNWMKNLKILANIQFEFRIKFLPYQLIYGIKFQNQL